MSEAVEIEEVPFDVTGDHVLVEIVERDDVTESGIVLAGMEKERPSQVVVVACGPDACVRIWTAVGEPDLTMIEPGQVLEVRRHQMIGVKVQEQDDRELYLLQPPAIYGVHR